MMETASHEEELHDLSDDALQARVEQVRRRCIRLYLWDTDAPATAAQASQLAAECRQLIGILTERAAARRAEANRIAKELRAEASAFVRHAKRLREDEQAMVRAAMSEEQRHEAAERRRAGARAAQEQLRQRVNEQARHETAERRLRRQLIDVGYRVLAAKLHPDIGGSHEGMVQLTKVRDRLKRET
jgi:chromosome segregation ATPase